MTEVVTGGDVRYVKTGAVHVAYRVIGDDGPGGDLLWYPGAPLLPMESIDDEPSLSRWQDRLASFCRVIEFDARGIGLSDPIPVSSPPTLEQWVEDTVAVLDAVGSRRASVLAPRDCTLEAIMLAATRPDRVEKLIIVNGAARMRQAPDYPAGIPNHLVDWFLSSNTEPAGAEPDPDGRPAADVLSFAAPTVAGDKVFRAWWDRAGRRGASPATAKAVLDVLYRADVRPLLPLVDAPTLVLHNLDSRNLRIGHGRYLAEHLPHARLVELEGQDCLYWVGDTDVMLDEIEEFLTGERRGPHAERILATVLFTDIVGSTELVTRLGERRWRDLLDRHDEIVARQIRRFRGHAIKTTGDGVLATFDGPARAVLCAAAIRDALIECDIHVRAGLHIGELEVRGDDIAGIAVHAAARIEAAAGAGEILASRTLVDLIVGSGIEVVDRGTHALKGLPAPMQLFAVTGTP